MVTTFRGPANTYLTTTTGGTTSEAEQREEVINWVKALEPWQTPFLDKVMSSDEFSQELHQWGQSQRIELESTLDGATLSGATSLTVATGEGTLFQEYMVISVFAYQVGTDIPDETTRENMWITGISGDVLTVTPAFGSTAKAHADASVVRIIGTAEPLNDEHTEAPRIRGVRAFNYPQRFQAKLTADKRYQNTPTWEHPDNPLLADFADEVLKQKILLERSIFEGTRKAGVGNASPSTFGGIETFLTSNDVDLLGAQLTPAAIDNVLADLWLGSDSAEGKVLVMGMTEARILDSHMDALRQAEVTSDTSNRVVRQYRFRTGTFEVAPMRNVPRGKIYLLDYNNIKVRPFKGLNWHTAGRDGVTFAVDHDVKAISGDFTLEVQREKEMAIISNFDANLANY